MTESDRDAQYPESDEVEDGALTGANSHDDTSENEPEKELAHSGYVVVVGKPNVGKSTLMNRILGEKIAIVSPKPQTTRLRQLGIYTEDNMQVIFIDTPGIHQPRHRLGEFMVRVATEALQDGDVVLFVADVSTMPADEDRQVAEIIREACVDPQGVIRVPVILALNKIDLTKAENVLPHVDAYRAVVPHIDWVTLSAALGDGVQDLLKRIAGLLPPGPLYFPEDQLSDMAMRDLVAEIVREKALLMLDKEVPHAVAVEVEEYTERSPTLTYIRVAIYVERDSQKAILIGAGGSMLKQIASQARVDIESLTGTQVYLEPWVKVLKNWRRDPDLLRRLGYKVRR